MKKCPFCAEEIQDDAIKCRHCGEFLNFNFRPLELTREEKKKIPWYFGTYFIVTVFLCAGPAALPFVWLRPQTSKTVKVVLSVIIIVLSWIMIEFTITSINNIKQYYELMNQM